MQNDFRTLSKLISKAEDHSPELYKILEKIYKPKSKTKVIGLTGSPGVGKSTLCNELITRIRSKNKKVAVVAVARELAAFMWDVHRHVVIRDRDMLAVV
jgi:LAO/AO transport system kinase